MSAIVRTPYFRGDTSLTNAGLGGENVGLMIDHKDAAAFRSSGYANLTTNSTYTGGVVRQHGNLSFTRVFEAGHAGKTPNSTTQEKILRSYRTLLPARDILPTVLSDHALKGPCNGRDLPRWT
jgi:carboxypeptidase D